MGQIFDFPYRTVAEVSLHNLVRNLSTIRLYSGRDVIPVIKADAYGHGMVPVAKVLLNRGGCQMLAVATLEEAIRLRKEFNTRFSVLVLSGFLRHQIDAYVRHNLIPVIHSIQQLKSLQGVAQLPFIHLKIDTGMNRLGIRHEEMEEAMACLKRIPLKLSGLASHFANADEMLSNYLTEQIARFEHWYRELQSQRLLHTDAKIHVANSSGILRKGMGFTTAVRPGLSLYGVLPNPNLNFEGELLPAMQWKTRVLAVKRLKSGESVGYGRTYTATQEETLGVLPVGYADGYPRLLSNRGEVLINGRRVPVRGRVSMDLISIDLTHVSDVREGSLAVLLGTMGDKEISAWDVATGAETIPYEIFCGLSDRVPRIYLDSEAT